MRLYSSNLFPLLIIGVNFATASVTDWIPTGDCLKLLNIASGLNHGFLIDVGRAVICNNGCAPQLSDYEAKWRNEAQQTLQAHGQTYGISQYIPQYMDLLDYVIGYARDNCGVAEFESQDMCQNDEQWSRAADCMQKNVHKMAIAKAWDMLPLASLRSCNQHLKLLTDPVAITNFGPAVLSRIRGAC